MTNRVVISALSRIQTVEYSQELNDNILVMNKTNYTIGRAEDNDVVIDSDHVSRHHLELVKHPILEPTGLDTDQEEWFVWDNDSTNGIYINGVQTNRCYLTDGDQLSLGHPNLGINYRFYREFNSVETQNYLGLLDDTVVIVESDGQLNRLDTEDYEDISDGDLITDNEFDDSLSEDLKCSICMDHFDKPVVLNCSHTYCESCIESWKKSNLLSALLCPICRVLIVTQNRALVLDNLLAKLT